MFLQLMPLEERTSLSSCGQVSSCKRVVRTNGKISEYSDKGTMECTTRKTVEVKQICLVATELYKRKQTWNKSKKGKKQAFIVGDLKCDQDQSDIKDEMGEGGEVDISNAPRAVGHMLVHHAIKAILPHVTPEMAHHNADTEGSCRTSDHCTSI